MEDRKKKPRFSEKEIELLVQGVKERSDIINSKFSDVVNNSKKKQAWVEVMEAVNAVSFTIRTVDELKKKWDDVKRGTKKRASAVHKERCKTGSGKLDIMPLSTVEEDIVSVMGEERIFGFSSYVDTMIPPVPELKQFLQERGVSCTLLRKIDLVRLCELATELNLEIIPTDDGGDYNVMDKKRRTVQVNGDDIVIPSPTDVCSWQTQLNNMPDIQTYDILSFLLTYCKWENNRLQTYKSDNGFRLFSSNHIDDVQISPVLEHDYMYIKATCAPETRQNSIPYTTWLLVHQSGQVMSAGCTCVA